MIGCNASQAPAGLPRRSLGAEVTRTERFRQERVLRFDSEYRIKAANHSAGRNEAVGKLLCYLSLLRSAGAIRREAAVEWDRAHLQAFRASEGREAAHVLPCQILVDQRRPSDLVVPGYLDRARIRQALEEFFGHVTSLPKVFNVADGRAEDHCLRGALVTACESVIRGTQPVQRTAGVLKRGVGEQQGEILRWLSDVPEAAHVGIDHDAVQRACAAWRQNAQAAFERAAAAVRSIGATVDGQDASGEVLYILERYRESLALPPVSLNDKAIFHLEEELWA